MPAPAAVEAFGHAGEPGAAVRIAGRRRDPGIAVRGLGRIGRALLAEHAGAALPQGFRQRLHEQRVDIGIDAALGDQRLQSHEVGGVGVAVARHLGIGVPEVFHQLAALGPAQLQRGPDAVPPRAPGFVFIVQHHGFRSLHRQARGQAQVVHQVERLGLRLEAEHEMEGARDHAGRSSATRNAASTRSAANSVRTWFASRAPRARAAAGSAASARMQRPACAASGSAQASRRE